MRATSTKRKDTTTCRTRQAIKYEVPTFTRVDLNIVNILGQTVLTKSGPLGGTRTEQLIYHRWG
jgi:hypothetical protein